jgi:copper homeostasis protein CutC
LRFFEYRHELIAAAVKSSHSAQWSENHRLRFCKTNERPGLTPSYSL